MLDFNEAKWAEGWIDILTQYVLVVFCFADDLLAIYDPQLGKLLSETFPNYQDARYWLTEDEFDEIQSRYVFDQPITPSPLEQNTSQGSVLSQAEWVEVWMSYADYEYVFLLYGFMDGTLRIYDIREKVLINEIFTSYLDADIWLSDEETTTLDEHLLIKDLE